MADLIKIVIYLILTTCSVLTQDPPRPIIDVCKQISPCSCQYSNGVTVDLAVLSSNDSTNPRFKDVRSEIVGGAKYSWNPCSPFTEGDGCINVTLCEIIAGAPTPKYVPIGKLEDAMFDHNTVDGGLQLQYSLIGEENRTTIILFFCNESADGEFIVKGEEPPDSGKYYFELRSKHVCGAPETTVNPSQTTTQVTTTENSSNQPHPIIDVCMKTSPCSCQYTNGDKIDLSALSNSDSSNPRFKDMPAEGLGGALYSWNPCYAFTEETCKDVALCEIISGAPAKSYIPIGRLDDAEFDHDVKTGDLQLQYSIIGEENRTAYIRLFCNQYEDGQFIIKGESPANSGKYYFELESKHVCRSLPSPSNGLGAGVIIIIVLAVLVGVYLIGGMTYQKCVNNASGKEIIPNYHIWAGIGNAIKSGVVYVFTCGRSEYTEIDSPSERTPIQSQHP